MRVILFGATGMVGQGVLRECLLDADVTEVVAVVRSSSGVVDPKFREIVHADLFGLAPIEEQLGGFDACFFCLGVSAAGMSEADYVRVTFDLTTHVASALLPKNPAMCFVYVSGAGTDSSEKGRSMWARVKGRTENALLAMPFRSAYMFRPGFIQPQHGVRSKTALYRAVYAVLGPIAPALRAIAPRFVTTSEAVGRAMLRVAKSPLERRVVENDEIHRLGSVEKIEKT